MAAAGAGDFEGLQRRLAAVPGLVVQQVCKAFAAYAGKNYSGVIGLLEPLTLDFARLGGSGAQRAVLEDTLDAARQRLRA